MDMTQEELKKEIDNLTSMKEEGFKSTWDFEHITEAERQIQRQEEIIKQEKANYESRIKQNKEWIKKEKKKIKESEKHIKQDKEIKKGLEIRINMVKQIKDNQNKQKKEETKKEDDKQQIQNS